MTGSNLCDTTQRLETARHTAGELAQRVQLYDGVLTHCNDNVSGVRWHENRVILEILGYEYRPDEPNAIRLRIQWGEIPRFALKLLGGLPQIARQLYNFGGHARIKAFAKS